MADDFVKVLSVGIGMFIVFLILAYAFSYPPQFSSSYSYDSDSYSSKAQASYKQVIEDRGYYYLRTFSLKDFGSYEVSTKRKEIGKVEVGSSLQYSTIRQDNIFIIKNGIFERRDKEYVFEAHDPKKIRVSFKINRTNKYGKLIILFNNKEIFRNYTYNGERINIEVQDNISSTNTFVFTCESSGARIWAPTTYEIVDLKIDVLDYTDNVASTDIYLEPDEYKGLKNVELDFNVIKKSGSGKLKIYVNNELAKEEYYSPSAKLHTITLNKELFSPGVNSISLVSDKDTTYMLDNLLITTTYLSSQKTTRTQLTLTISPTTYDYIENENVSTFLEIDVSRVLVDKGIEVEVNGHEYSIDTLSVGSNILNINKEDLEEGINVLVFSTQGYYNIPRVKFGIRKGE